jgi:Cytochrome bd terminal oxidase subunit I
VSELAWMVKKDPDYLRMTKFFGTLFLINFAVGVVTGIVQEFQFERARKTAVRIAVVTVPVAAGFLVASQVAHGRLATDLTAAAVALLAVVAAIARGKEGWAFAGTRSPYCSRRPRCSVTCGRTCCRPPRPRPTASPFTMRHRRTTLSLS